MQVVGYDTRTPTLLVSASDGIDSIALAPGTELDYRLGDRHCVSTIHDGRHVTCDNTRAPCCSDHRHTWIYAKCTGTYLKNEMNCYEDHTVYLAAFASDTFKVGATREWRLDTRLREQRMDRAAHVRAFSGDRVAREYEAELATKITDRIHVPTGIKGSGQAVDAAVWDALIVRFDPIETFAFDYGLGLIGSPVVETIAAETVRGVKRRVLVLDHHGVTYAVDIRGLVGHELSDGGTDRDLQSSLGTFG